jgi:hypothetical protein
MMSGLGQQYTSLTAQASQLQGQAQLGFAQAGLLFGGAKFALGSGFSGIYSGANAALTSFDPFSTVSS